MERWNYLGHVFLLLMSLILRSVEEAKKREKSPRWLFYGAIFIA